MKAVFSSSVLLSKSLCLTHAPDDKMIEPKFESKYKNTVNVCASVRVGAQPRASVQRPEIDINCTA